MSKKQFYITTPLYYVNAKPHIGHAYTNILCDTFARFHRLLGQDVFFMTGTDEHGSKIAKVAREQGKEPQLYVDEIVPHFKALWQSLGIEYDYFIRTTDASHKAIVQDVLRDLEKRGEIYKAKYTGWYSIKSETFYAESELVNGRCPDTGGEVQKIEEENYFFKLSRYQDWLIEYIQKHPDFILPVMRANEVLGFLKQPLQDLCITRPKERLSWGIEYPGSKDHVIYVWFDALVNYISGIGYGQESARFKSLWPADVHVVGKDILRHHAVYWPIMLKAIGVEMPKTLLAHGWWTIEGAKVSKSSGNIIDPVVLIQKYGVDPFRYFMLHEVTVGFDGAYSEDLLRERYTNDLANDLGNLWFRLAAMIGKYFEGKIPPPSDAAKQDPLLQRAYGLWDEVCPAMLAYDPRKALDALWAVVSQANHYVEEKKPWSLAKNPANQAELAGVLWVLAEALAHLAYLLQPFVPATADRMLERLHLKGGPVIRDAAAFRQPLVKVGALIEKGEALFPKLEDA